MSGQQEYLIGLGQNDGSVLPELIVRQNTKTDALQFVESVTNLDFGLKPDISKKFKEMLELLPYQEVINQYHRLYDEIDETYKLEEDEDLLGSASDELRRRILPTALEKATTREECETVAGLAYERVLEIKKAAQIKMASLK